LEILFLRFKRFILLVARLAKMVKGHSPIIESLIAPKAANRNSIPWPYRTNRLAVKTVSHPLGGYRSTPRSLSATAMQS
jgi:hypothetical protein